MHKFLNLNIVSVMDCIFLRFLGCLKFVAPIATLLIVCLINHLPLCGMIPEFLLVIAVNEFLYIIPKRVLWKVVDL